MAKAKPAEEPVETPAQAELEALTASDPTPEVQAPEAAAPETPPAPTYLDRVKGLGFAEVENEEQARDRLLTAYEQTLAEQKRIKDELDQQKVYAKYGQEYLEGLRSQPQPSAPAPTSQPERKDWWNPPTYNSAVADRYREAKQDGTYGWKDNTPAEIRASAESYQAYIEKWAHDLATNPKEALRGIKDEIRAELLSEFDTKYQTYRQQETVEEFADRVRNENDWLFEKDARTNQVLYDRYSSDGQMVMRFIDQAAKFGITSPQNQWEYAKSLYDAEKARTQVTTVTQQQTNQDVAATQKKNLLARARGVGPNRNGSATPANNPNASVQNPLRSAGELLREQMRADGTSPTLS